MISDITGFQAINIYCGKCDLRKGIDGLATLVKEQFHLDPFQKDVLFLFCGCRTDRFKGLVWEGDGSCLLYKRIEAGRLRWPRSQVEAAKDLVGRNLSSIDRNDDTGTFLYPEMQLYRNLLPDYAEPTFSAKLSLKKRKGGIQWWHFC